MDIDFLKDRFAGCILGMAIGDALGAPVENMTPYQIMNKYHSPVDGYFSSKEKGLAPGQYTTETNAAIKVAKVLIAHEKLEATSKLFSDIPTYEQAWGSTSLFTRAIPVALMAAAKRFSPQDLVAACRTLAEPMKISKPHLLAMIIFADIIRELIVNPKQYERPYDLYDSEHSLLGRMIRTCAKTEGKFGEEGIEDRLSERLDFVRRRLMKDCDIPRFVGLNGSSNDIKSVLAVGVFCYMKTPDDFSAITKIVSMGGPASSHGALVGALIGASIGSSLMPQEMKDNVKNGVRLEGLAFELLNKMIIVPPETQSAEKPNDGEDDYHEDDIS